jgi:hypothetical protein
VEDILDSKIFIVNSNILFIGMGMMWASALGNQSRTYQMPWRRCMNFFDNIQTNPSLFLVELINQIQVNSWLTPS